MNTDYFKTQLVVTVAGLLAALVLSFIDYESIASFWYLIAGFSVFIMLRQGRRVEWRWILLRRNKWLLKST